ncbi:hypothetical protein AALP_AA7G053500 [Arabis alpina]|uniref:Uncharacterized protein n=1 Tax=Arabis alpina TaxID=50452 RepID=A0A087GG20_ARAAL|nr:hypothetical protein AALP_AA7G053500 [Arabis alpina]
MLVSPAKAYGRADFCGSKTAPPTTCHVYSYEEGQVCDKACKKEKYAGGGCYDFQGEPGDKGHPECFCKKPLNKKCNP